jgi:formylglycine-generating enzyme required for sulfatase activity
MLQKNYWIGRVLGNKLGGFGVTYLAWDKRLDIHVAIKEYLPFELAGREPDGLRVRPHSGPHEETYQEGLLAFYKEAKTLAQFDHPHIIKARAAFEENATAYLVMDYLQGQSLGEYLGCQGRVSEARALEIMRPVLEGLEEVHAHSFLHRDLKPDNIYLIQAKGKKPERPILLDFGSARWVNGERTQQSLTAVLTPGYAPFEQYGKKGQGPWTDVYGAAAVLYRLTTGEAPQDAWSRMNEDELKDPKTLAPELSYGFALALLQGLQLRGKDRPQSLEAFRALLFPEAGGHEAPSSASKTVDSAEIQSAPIPPALPTAPSIHGWPALRVQTLQSETAQALGREVHFSDALSSGGVGPEMAIIPAGEFLMGSPPEEVDRYKTEGPQHRVAIAQPFALGRYAVTFEDYDRYAEEAKARKPEDRWGRGRQPVINVYWQEARAYCAWLSEQTGARYRLPSEAEWEYACRAGTASAFWWGDAISPEQANYDGNYAYRNGLKGVYRKQTLAVDTFAPNPFGLYQMHGNVWEWMEDGWHEDYQGAPDDGTAWLGAEGDDRRVVRGGAWSYYPQCLRSADRGGDDAANGGVGFRLARAL